MRIGVALGGLCDFVWSTKNLANWYHVVRHTADKYAKKLGIKKPMATTTVKPSGTLSLLNGSSPGMRATNHRYYIRRIRMASDSLLAESLRTKNVAWEYDRVLGKHTSVFSFAIEARSSTRNPSVEEQLNMQFLLQRYWSDNGVSNTILFDHKEVTTVAKCLKRFMPHLKGVSLLANQHCYEQAPYEAITKDTYHHINDRIDANTPLLPGEIVLSECDHASCPSR